MLTCMKKLNKWNFEKKMRVVVSLAISGTSILVLFIFLIVEMVFVTEQSADTIESQMGLLASNYEETLEQYWNFSVALVINDCYTELLLRACRQSPGQRGRGCEYRTYQYAQYTEQPEFLGCYPR